MNRINPIKVFAGTQSRYLGEKIAQHLGTELGKHTLYRFSDGEYQPAYNESVRGCDVFIVQSTFQPTDNLFELLLLIDAAKRASASQVVAVMPYFGFARQERKDKPRAAIGAKLVANMLTAAGVDRIMTMDLHAPPIQGFFDVPVDHLYASPIFVPYIKNLGLKDLVIAAPDMGGTKRAKAYSNYLGVDMVICHKFRKEANKIDQYKIIGDIRDKNVIIVDDMIDTAGTISTAANMMRDEGALSVRVVASHPVLSGPAYDRINESFMSELLVTDSIPIKPESQKIKVLSIAEIFAEVIEKVYNYQSISSHYII